MKLALRALFFLFALLQAVPADAAARFGVCVTTCTWDGSSTLMWSATSGGATGASVPGAADDVTFDAATCVGGVTCTITINTNFTIESLTTGACTASTTGCIIDFSANNNSPNITGNGPSGWTNSGTGTRTVNCGTGTFTISGSGLTGLAWQTTTNLTLSCASATFSFSGNTTNAKAMQLGSTTLTWPAMTIATNTSGGYWLFTTTGAPTITSLTLSANYYIFGNGSTFTMTTLALNSPSSSNLVSFVSNDFASAATISSPNTVSLSWSAIRAITFAGAGSKTATSSFDLGRNSGSITITPPSSGGGGRIIGG